MFAVTIIDVLPLDLVTPEVNSSPPECVPSDVVENLKYLANRSDNRCYLYFHPRIDGSQWTNADFLKSHCEEMMLAKWKEYVVRDDRHELESNEILNDLLSYGKIENNNNNILFISVRQKYAFLMATKVIVATNHYKLSFV